MPRLRPPVPPPAPILDANLGDGGELPVFGVVELLVRGRGRVADGLNEFRIVPADGGSGLSDVLVETILYIFNGHPERIQLQCDSSRTFLARKPACSLFLMATKNAATK